MTHAPQHPTPPEPMDGFHLSITGLRVKPGLLNRLRFTFHALRAYQQARRAPGNLHVSAGAMNGVQHTITAWTDRDAMLAYIRSGPHLRAMKAFHRIATGSTLGFTATRIPSLAEAHERWKKEGKAYTR